MSSISDALKRAQQERDRLRNQEGQAAAPDTPEAQDASLASVVLKKTQAPDTSSGIPSLSALKANAPAITPVADAIRQAPPVPPPAVKAQQQAAETIVEDYASKTRLNLPPAMVVYHERSGAIAEQYRKMRDNLMAGNPKRDPQMLVVTSSVAGEGKTTTVMNLGLSLVEIRANRVLLLDGCLQQHPGGGASARRKTLTELLKLSSEAGLAELLTDPVEDLQPFIKATPWNRLYVLPAGNHITAMTATDMLKSETLRKILRQLKGMVDWVLIDAPPALTMPHAGLFGGPSDGMLLAVALHHTPQEKVQTTVRKLKSMNLPLKSCIVTRA
jgi:Mrp family chromosome partitioning ATPase